MREVLLSHDAFRMMNMNGRGLIVSARFIFVCWKTAQSSAKNLAGSV